MADSQDVHDLVWDLLDAVPVVNAYDGEVPKTPPTDPDGRVSAYAVLYFSPGRRHANALDGGQRSVEGSFQVTCVGGDPTRALWCVDRVLAALSGASVTVDGRPRQIRVREDDPGTVRRDDNATPPRHYVPLLFQLHMP
jgi:hypothetical protein